jgi:hypothetical protein
MFIIVLLEIWFDKYIKTSLFFFFLYKEAVNVVNGLILQYLNCIGYIALYYGLTVNDELR